MARVILQKPWPQRCFFYAHPVERSPKDECHRACDPEKVAQDDPDPRGLRKVPL